MSYQPCRIVVHLILLSSGLGGAFAFGDNRRFTPECGFELVKLTMLICVCRMVACGQYCRYSSRMIGCGVLCSYSRMTCWLNCIHCVYVNLQQATHSFAFIQYISVFVFKDMKSCQHFLNSQLLPIITIFPYSQAVTLHSL